MPSRGQRRSGRRRFINNAVERPECVFPMTRCSDDRSINAVEIFSPQLLAPDPTWVEQVEIAPAVDGVRDPADARVQFGAVESKIGIWSQGFGFVDFLGRFE